MQIYCMCLTSGMGGRRVTKPCLLSSPALSHFSDRIGKTLGAHTMNCTHTHTHTHTYTRVRTCGNCSSQAQLQPQQHTWANWAGRERSQHPKDLPFESAWACASLPFPRDLEPLLHWWSDKVIDWVSLLSLPHPNSQPIHPSYLDGGKEVQDEKWWMSMEKFFFSCGIPEWREVKGWRGGWVTWWSETQRERWPDLQTEVSQHQTSHWIFLLFISLTESSLK